MKIHFLSESLRYAVLEMLMYFVYIPLSLRCAPCASSHKAEF